MLGALRNKRVITTINNGITTSPIPWMHMGC